MYTLRRSRVLWHVTSTGNAANARAAAGLIGANPTEIDEDYTAAGFTLQVTFQNNLNLTGVRIYGSWSDLTSSPESTPRFPNAGNAAEAMCAWSNVPGPMPAAGEAQSRSPSLLSLSNVLRIPLTLLPFNLLLEWDTSGAGANPQVLFDVIMCALGPEVTGGA